MQRLIESTLINKILDKYQSRLTECQDKWNKDYDEIKTIQNQEQTQYIDHERKQRLVEDLNLVNVQIGAYECIVKDLKELIK